MLIDEFEINFIWRQNKKLNAAMTTVLKVFWKNIFATIEHLSGKTQSVEVIQFGTNFELESTHLAGTSEEIKCPFSKCGLCVKYHLFMVSVQKSALDFALKKEGNPSISTKLQSRPALKYGFKIGTLVLHI